MGTPNQTKSKRLKIAVIILTVLLVLSTAGLAARFIYLQFFAPVRAAVTVSNNLIGEESSLPTESNRPETDSQTETESSDGSYGNSEINENASTNNPAAKLELYRGQPEDNQRFEVSNMLPGDTETKYFGVKAYHDKDMDIFFKADITEQTKNLGNALHIKVTHLETEKVLCDAPFAEVNGKEFSELFKATNEKATTAYYRIDVSVDTSVGNEYQAAMLKADFKWYVKDEGSLTAPQTKDTANITLWIVLAVSSFLLVLLLLWKHRKEDKRHE